MNLLCTLERESLEPGKGCLTVRTVKREDQHRARARVLELRCKAVRRRALRGKVAVDEQAQVAPSSHPPRAGADAVDHVHLAPKELDAFNAHRVSIDDGEALRAQRQPDRREHAPRQRDAENLLAALRRRRRLAALARDDRRHLRPPFLELAGFLFVAGADFAGAFLEPALTGAGGSRRDVVPGAGVSLSGRR